MGLQIARAFGALAPLSLVCLLASCSAAAGPAGSAGAIAAADHIHVEDNFGVAGLEQHFESVAKAASETVVAISATEAPVQAESSIRSDDLNADKLAAMLASVDRTVGTGFIIDSDGYILTNDHVISGAEQLWVTTDSHKVYAAIVVGSDPRADLALLKIPATHLPTAHFASNEARRGQWTIAIGNPFGMAGGGEMSVSVGVVSALNRSLTRLSDKEDRLYSGLIQTTAQINPGNSGGPLFDLQGNVIGINTAVVLPQKQTNGIGFAIPADARVQKIVDNLKQGREVVYGYLGVSVSTPTPRQLREANLAEDAGGVFIESVEPKSPAATANLKAGDILTRLDGQAIHDSDDFVRLVGICPVNDPVPAVIAGRSARTVSLHLTPRPMPSRSAPPNNGRLRWRGMLLAAIPSGWIASPAKSSPGVLVIGVDSASSAVPPGIRAGSVIIAVAGKVVHDLAELQRIINDTPAAQCRIEVQSPPSSMVLAN